MDHTIDGKNLETNQSQPKSSDYAPYPKIDASLPSPPPPISVNKDNSDLFTMESEVSKSKSPSKSVTWSSELTSEARSSRSENPATTLPTESNPYVTAASSPLQSQSASVTVKDTIDTVKQVLGRWGKKVGETSKKSQDLAGNMWQHLKTSPNFADAAMGRIAQGAKVLAEGGYEKIFRQTFETVPEEQLERTYACYLSTSAGPVMGILYISTAKLAFCSDNPLPYKSGEQEEWSYYKVVIPLHQLRAVNTSRSKVNRAEKYIQVISVDNHEFWFMGFVNYDSAVHFLQDAHQAHSSLQSQQSE